MKQLLTGLFILTSIVCFGQNIKYVAIDNATFRSSPNAAEYNILELLNLNDLVEVIENTGTWSKVKFEGKEGYITSKSLSETKSGTTEVNSKKVLICNSNTAYAYHSSYCAGLNKCTHSVSEVSISEATGLGRTPCKTCYPSSASSSSSSSYRSSQPSKSYSNGSCPSVQCSGTTQKGLRCKRMTTSCSGRCYQH